MSRSPAIELWNLTPEGECLVGAQTIFNVVGHVSGVENARQLTYSLNGGTETEVAVQGLNTRSKRLVRDGDFNIDTITLDQLGTTNDLELTLYRRDGHVEKRSVRFRIRLAPGEPVGWRMSPEAASRVESLGQVVDGRWVVGTDERGRPYLSVTEADAGYDRILLFGHRSWTSGYEVRARFRVDRWTPSISQGVGAAFKWNDHRIGDGSELPLEWSTGVAWAFSESPGLTVRFGADARKAADGRWAGETVVAEASLGRLRRAAERLCRRLVPTLFAFPPVRPGVEYAYHLAVDDTRLALTLWDVRRPQPKPQVIGVVREPPLRAGSVGWIAHNCAVKLYEFSVAPAPTQANEDRP